MGVGDRYSRRTDRRSRIAIPAIRSIPSAPAVDDRELDDPFSAWDDDDAGAHRPAQTSVAPTRIERKPAKALAASPADAVSTPPVLAEGSTRRATPLVDPLVDPVAMRDIVIARAQTLEDPLTSRVLAEIARKRTRSDVGIPLPGLAGADPDAGPVPGAAQADAAPQESPSTGRATVRIGLPRPPGAGPRSGTRTAARPPEALAGPEAPPSAPGRRRPIARDEPFRKR